MSDEAIDRRRFLLAVAATAAAATATGAGAALLKRGQPITTPSIPLPAAVTNTQAVVTSSGEMSGLAAELITAQADNIRLQAELDAAQRRIAAIESANGSSGSTITNLQTELDDAGARLGILSGLIALYEQLEEIDVNSVLVGGVTALEGAFVELTDDLPTLEEGLALGQQALQQLENELPAMSAARSWLDTQMERLGGFYGGVLVALADVVDEAGDFLQMLGRWFARVLDWVPFGMGDKASRVLTALTNMLGETTATMGGYSANAGAHLDRWLKPEQAGAPLPLQTQLVQPLRDGALAPAGSLASKAAATKATFKTAVADPAKVARINRGLLRDQITAYRTTHKLDR